MSSPAGSLGSGGDRGSAARRAWRVVRFPLALLVLAYIALVIYRIPAVMNKQKSAEAVTRIQAQHLTIADIDGSHLPPQPDPSQVDATVAGVDANGNGIRDDVELAIFKKYPHDIRIRAAELQYAMELQLELTSVFDSETWRALALLEGNGISCLVDVAFVTYTNSRDQITKSAEWEKDVEMLVFDTSLRKQQYDRNQGYQTAYATSGKEGCDIQMK